MSVTRKQLAEIIEGYDSEISALQLSKRTTYEDYRHGLAKAGYDKDAVKAEIEAFKLALRRKAAVAKSSDDAVLAKDELVDEIFTEITAVRAPRATRVENVEQFGVDQNAENSEEINQNPNMSGALSGSTSYDPETGEIHEPDATLRPQTGAVETSVASSEAPELTSSDPLRSVAATREDAGAGASEPTNVTPLHRFNPATHFANSKGLLRLHGCTRPEACAGSHRALCHSCGAHGAAQNGGAA